MKRAWPLLAAFAAACASGVPSAPAPGGPIVEVRESFTCPLPPSRGLVTIARDGKAERVVFDGLEFENGKTKSSREQMTLSPKDASALFDLVSDSGWKGMPEGPDSPPSCADCCSGALLIKTTEGGKSLRYASNAKPAKLDALIKGIDAILARGTWTRVFYDWEKQR